MKPRVESPHDHSPAAQIPKSSVSKPFPKSALPPYVRGMANNDEDRYVVKHADGWSVKKENAKRGSNVFGTQAEATAAPLGDTS